MFNYFDSRHFSGILGWLGCAQRSAPRDRKWIWWWKKMRSGDKSLLAGPPQLTTAVYVVAWAAMWMVAADTNSEWRRLWHLRYLVNPLDHMCQAYCILLRTELPAGHCCLVSSSQLTSLCRTDHIRARLKLSPNWWLHCGCNYRGCNQGTSVQLILVIVWTCK